MAEAATIIQPPLRSYRGSITTPQRWATWQPRQGDIVVCTPPKCGTTWTQTMVATVDAIDHETREVTLSGEGGTVTFTASDDVRNLAQVEAGDRVIAEVSEEISIEVFAKVDERKII